MTDDTSPGAPQPGDAGNDADDASEAWSGFAMDEPEEQGRASASGFLLDSVRYRRIGRHIMSFIIVALFVAGAGMFTYPFFTDLYTNQVVQERLEQEYAELGPTNLDVDSFDEWQASVEEGRPLTKIAIPDLDVETLVVEGTSPEALRAGAGHYPTTPLPGQNGNVAIAGHRTTYGRPFNRMDQIDRGDRIWLITPVGEYEYETAGPPEGYSANVSGKAHFITDPKDWRVIEPTVEPSLTLTSCHPKGSAAQRIVIRAHLVESHPPGTYGS